MSKGGSQLSGCQIAQNRDSFCDFGRKLENLNIPELGFLIFGQRNKTSPGFAQFESQKIENHLLPTNPN